MREFNDPPWDWIVPQRVVAVGKPIGGSASVGWVSLLSFEVWREWSIFRYGWIIQSGGEQEHLDEVHSGFRWTAIIGSTKEARTLDAYGSDEARRDAFWVVHGNLILPMAVDEEEHLSVSVEHVLGGELGSIVLQEGG